MIGRLLGNRYKIIRELGSGGMARVYLAKDNKTFSLVAVKILYPQLSENFTYIQRFKREAKVAMGLSNPHIVSVLDYGADRDDYYLVMEYVEGETLGVAIREQGPLPWKRALTIAYEAAQALREAHRQHIVHRDIKPANIMITPEGTARILDFGIARGSDLPSLTQSGFVGSPYYISPQQAMGEEVDVRSDIYSLGVVLYEMLSNRLPFDAETPWPVIEQHISTAPPPLDETCPDLPGEVELLVQKMLAKDPEERFQTPAELMWAIQGILPEVVPTRMAEEREAPIEGAVERRLPVPFSLENFLERGPVVLLLIFMIVVLAGAVFEGYRVLVLPSRDCSAYLEAGLAAFEAFSESRDPQHLQEAIAQFDRGLGTCPNDATLQDERHLASLYLEGITRYEGEDWERAIASFEGLRNSGLDSRGAPLTELLYSAHVSLGDQYYQAGDLNQALQQYQAALNVEVADPTDARQKRDRVRAEIEATEPAPEPTRIRIPTPTPTPRWIPPTATPIALRYSAPRLLEPADGHPFGNFAITLKWEPVVGELGADECYRVSIFTTYLAQVDWTGSSGCLRATEYKLPAFLFDRSDTHEFTWFVWVSLDRPDASGEWIRLSPDSMQRTFYWGPQ